MKLAIDRIDHFVLTIASIERTVDFYTRVLGMESISFAGGRMALRFGRNKINLHPAGREYEPKALRPMPGSGDFCLIAAVPLERVIERLDSEGVRIEQGPVKRSGATGPISSVYFRDPDFNLVEISTYD